MFTRASKLPVPKNNTQTVVEKHVRSENSEKRSRTWHCAWLADANAEWKHGDKSKKDREIKTGRERERERERGDRAAEDVKSGGSSRGSILGNPNFLALPDTIYYAYGAPGVPTRTPAVLANILRDHVNTYIFGAYVCPYVDGAEWRLVASREGEEERRRDCSCQCDARSI
jgi:hypothetical protein